MIFLSLYSTQLPRLPLRYVYDPGGSCSHPSCPTCSLLFRVMKTQFVAVRTRRQMETVWSWHLPPLPSGARWRALLVNGRLLAFPPRHISTSACHPTRTVAKMFILREINLCAYEWKNHHQRTGGSGFRSAVLAVRDLLPPGWEMVQRVYGDV